MIDSQETMIQFVKIIERYPEIYDSTMDSYRIKYAAYKAWEKVAASVRKEMKEECTVNELKMKWKGIRSSFNRFKSKPNPCRRYYLCDALKFLEPFIKKCSTQGGHQSPDTYDENSLEDVQEKESWIEFHELCEDQDIKPNIELLHKPVEASTSSDRRRMDDASGSEDETYTPTKTKRKKSNDNPLSVSTDTLRSDDNDDNMQFFKSVLPDIKDFTAKEKRKFKVGILKLIDEIEAERKIIKKKESSSS
ncbi:uncharacterized protein LOC126369708 [Pectinophora gossypiella]|uniref:uncharacterized protein LOC126369708 n=1 Tax=Pectinophora gossypiella TaxID=13191 RepID=UPI00214F4973|nr:uncharacterized protein LOC126369708 [Pectinophora gossypiella]XP_049870236.1 uncharacterized protein LOC126369708 [Pectinophora gossypiella]